MFLIFFTSSFGQNTHVNTAPPGNKSNLAASTAFTQGAVSDSTNWLLGNAIGIIEFTNLISTNNYQNNSLIKCSIINVFVDNILLPNNDINNNSYWSFDGSTGTLIINNGLLGIGSDVRVVYRKLPFNTIYSIYNIVIKGNSIPNGALNSDTSTLPINKIVSRILGQGFPGQRMFVDNESTGNQCLFTVIGGQTQPTSFISEYNTRIRPLFQPGKINVLVTWEMVNELFYGMSRAQYQAKLPLYCDTAKADGWKVLVVTQTARDTGANRGFFNNPTIGQDVFGMNIITATDSVNTWLRANYTNFADGLIDWAGSSPILKNYPDSNTTYHYTKDGTHYSDTLSDAAGHFTASSILSFINEAVPNPYYSVNNLSVLSTYLSTANITSPTEVDALTNHLFKPLSIAGLWQYCDVIYPMEGDDPNGWKINAKDPANFTLIPINPGGGSDVLSFDKTTGLTTANNARVEVPRKDSSIHVCDWGVFVYTNKNTSASTPYIFGAANFSGRFFGDGFDAGTFNSTNIYSQAMNAPYTGVDAYYIGRNEIFREGLVRGTTSEVVDAPLGLTYTFLNSVNIPFGCYYLNATPTIFPATVPVRFATIIITKGLPANKVAQLAAIVHDFNTALGRSYLQIH